jgi:hypothetical protein
MSQHPSALYRALCDLADAFEQRERDIAEHEARIKALEARGNLPFRPPAALTSNTTTPGLKVQCAGVVMPGGTFKVVTDPAEIAAIFAKDDA